MKQHVHEILTRHWPVILVFPFVLCYVNLVTGQLANLKCWHVADHELVLVGSALYDDLRLVRGAARLITSLVIYGILQLPTIGCYHGAFELFWQSPVVRLTQMLLDHISISDDVRMLEAHTRCDLLMTGFVHKRKNGLFWHQSQPHTDESCGLCT